MRTEKRLRRQAVKRRRHRSINEKSLSHRLTPLLPCANCADKIAKAGIRRVVAYCGHISPDWRASAEDAERIFINAGVESVGAMLDKQPKPS